VFGVPPREVDPQRIGLLPQSFDPPERLTATELVGYYGGLYDAARDAESVLRDVGMADDADVWYETLSGGQKRRTCVATAIVNDPDLLFLDEPTTGIDPAGRRSIHRLIERLAGGGTTVFPHESRDGRGRAAGRPRRAPPGRENRRCRRSRGTDRRSRRRAALGGQAGRSRVRGGLRGGSGSDPGGALGRIGGESEDAPAVESTRKGLRIGGVRPEGIGDAVDALETAEIDFESLAWSEPSLEDVYLRLTGEEYSPRSEPLDEVVAPDGGDR